MENRWATMDTVLPEKDLHISGTVLRPNGLTFWLTAPRPRGVPQEEWERRCQDRWDIAFGKAAS